MRAKDQKESEQYNNKMTYAMRLEMFQLEKTMLEM